MKSYTVRVMEEGCGAWTFTGVEAPNKNVACAEAIKIYMVFCQEIDIAPLTAVATLEK